MDGFLCEEVKKKLAANAARSLRWAGRKSSITACAYKNLFCLAVL